MEAERRCQFWLPNKRRFCANYPLPCSSFCGNHNPSATEDRVPCPLDPSHSVSRGSLDSHVKRCPLRKQVLELEAQPFYQKGINSGCGGKETPFVSSEEKRRAIYKLTVPEFYELVRRIRVTHSSLSMGIADSYVVPEDCGAWLKQQHERKLPFQEKHALQQASIVGNMEAFGLVEKMITLEASEFPDEQIESSGPLGVEIDAPAVVEFGAGRGYLTHMLADCYGITKLFLVERRSYKLKADRSLRQDKNTCLERLRIDIEDLNLDGITTLRGLPYLAVGKHICGPATDLTLRCCLPEQYDQNKKIVSCYLKGLALATCCHHLCQWENYINKKYLENLGITKDDFHAITWFSSWAVDADHCSDLSNAINLVDPLHSIDTNELEMRDKDVEATIRSMNAVERARLGFLCKELIDIGRLMWLKVHGLDAHFVKYVPRNISPENHLLVARSSEVLH